jgi:small subunit ribosomal protein S20
LANTVQAKKRALQAEKARQRNVMQRSMYRTCLKKVVKAIEDQDLARAEEAYRAAVPILDRMARKGIIHKNKAARHKSRLTHHLRRLADAV